jgi:hypothetical protein
MFLGSSTEYSERDILYAALALLGYAVQSSAFVVQLCEVAA